MNNPPWLALLEAHSQAHEAWWFAFGLKEKRIMITPPPDPPDATPHAAAARITALRAALNNIAYSRWSTETPGQFVEVLQKMARDALIANAKLAKDRPERLIHIGCVRVLTGSDDRGDREWREVELVAPDALQEGTSVYIKAAGIPAAPAPAD